MPKMFGDLSYATPTPLYVGQPVEEMKALQQTADTKYKENKDYSDKLDVALSNLKVDDIDYKHKRAALEKLKGTLNDVVQKGDWETAHSVVSKAGKDLATDSALNQSVADLQKRQAHEAQLQKELNDPASKMGYTKDYVDQAIRLARERNKGVHINPVTGEYQGGYSAYTPAKQVDEVKKGEEIAKGWLADSMGTTVKRAWVDTKGQYGTPGDWVVDTEKGGTIKAANQNEIKAYVKAALDRDAEVQSYHGTLNDYDNFIREKKGVPENPMLGVPDDLAADKAASMAYLAANTPAEKQAIVNNFYNTVKNEERKSFAAGLNAAKYGYTERTSVDNQGLKANDFALILARRKEEDYKPVFTSPLEVGGLNSEMANPIGIRDKIQTTVDNTQNVLKAAYTYGQQYNLSKGAMQLLEMASKGANITAAQFKDVVDDKGVNHQAEMIKFLAQIQQNQKVAKEAVNYDNKMKAQAGLVTLDKNGNVVKDNTNNVVMQKYNQAVRVDLIKELGGTRIPTTDPRYDAHQAYIQAQASIPSGTPEQIIKKAIAIGKANGKDVAPTLNSILHTYTKENQDILREDPNYGKYLDLLDKNAKESKVEIGMTTFGSKSVDEELGNIILTDLNNNGSQGATWTKTGQDLADGDGYKNIGDKKPTSIRWALTDNGIQLVFRPYDKDGKEMQDYVKMPAPDGVYQYLVSEGHLSPVYADMTSKVEAIGQHQDHQGKLLGYDVTAPFKSDAGTSPDNTGKYTAVLPTKEHPEGELRRFDNTMDLISTVLAVKVAAEKANANKATK